MSVLVVDGIRRPNRPTLMTPSVAEAVMPSPQPLLPPPTSSGLWGIDGLARRPTPGVVDQSVLPEIGVTERTGRAISLPLAAITLATAPVVVGASVFGIRSVLAHHPDVRSSDHTAATAQPVEANDQAKFAPQSSPTPAATAAPTGLQQVLDSFGNSDTYSVIVKDLKSGQLAVMGPDRSFRSASFYKLFVAQEIYHRIDTGQLSYSSPAGSGTGNTISGCLNLMITISDNGCGEALGSLIGWNNLTQILHGQDYSGTNLNQPMVTTPRDVAKLFERLYQGNLVSADSTTQFLNLLKGQKVNNRLPQGLPSGTSFAHKTGDLYGFMHDGGIVFGPKTDYLVVMMGAPGANPSDFATLSQRLWSYFNQ